MNYMKKPIVIVGGGFSGVNAALNLKKINSSLPIVVIDSNSHFLFKPLLYEVLSNEIKQWEVAPTFNNIFSNTGITFLRNHLENIDLAKNIVEFQDDLKIQYQYLILCTGSTHNNFGIEGVDKNCYFFSTNEDQIKLKSFLERPLIESSNNRIFIVGAGPSGVELACKIDDIYNQKFRISIIEKTNEILSNNKFFNREEAEKSIEKRNIELLLNTSVNEIREDEIVISSKSNQVENLIYAGVIWTAGIKPNLPTFTQEIETRNSRILINKYLQMTSNTNVFALGDIAIIDGDDNYPVTAQVAMQQGIHVAKNINLKIDNNKLLPFEYIDKGEMISLGIGNASISGLGLTLSGKLAFELRRIIYASKMPRVERSFKSTASWILTKKALIQKNKF